ncbi:MAG: septum site-determining protein MinC [Syntrophomonas sp.]|nr:septum site-determining protein MinC [Syntrophomonas sp.]
MIIDLSKFSSLEDMKTELERSLTILEKYADENQVCIDTGSQRLTERQLRELESILGEHGLQLKELRNSQSSGQGQVSKPVAIYPDANDMLEPGETALIYRHLRSGQKFFTRGNVVILGDINPGAEVIAGGNILVMGALKGMAHAGALGDENSVVAAFRLSPIQLRIANHITRPPDGDKITVNNPELARIRAGKVVIEKLKI